MTATIQQAAAALQRKIHAPKGAVNAYVYQDHGKQVIRVLIDPLYWQFVKDVPSVFEGYLVLAEKRSPSVALH